MKKYIFGITFLLSSVACGAELNLAVLCNGNIAGKIATGEIAEENAEREHSLCVLAGAAKNAFNLVSDPGEPSRLRAVAKSVEAICNGKYASGSVIGSIVEERHSFMNRCFISGITANLNE